MRYVVPGSLSLGIATHALSLPFAITVSNFETPDAELRLLSVATQQELSIELKVSNAACLLMWPWSLMLVISFFNAVTTSLVSATRSGVGSSRRLNDPLARPRPSLFD